MPICSQERPRTPRLAASYPSVGGQAHSQDAWPAFHEVLAEAGARASTEAPLFWLRLEPRTDADILRYQVLLTSWPGGVDRVIAWAGPQSAEVRRV